jgi:hypothetical protein
MARKEMTALSIMIFFGFSILISLPIILLSFGYSPYYSIEFQDSIEGVFNSSSIVDLNLNIDHGDVKIQYTFSPVDYHARIDVSIDMIGQNIPEKNYTDFFNIEWEKTDNLFTFTMEVTKNISDFNTVLIEHNVNIIVTLNPIILFNINTYINVEGNFNLEVPGGIKVNNIDVYTEKGNTILNFVFCNIRGNISGKSGVGDIELNLINVQYFRNCAWNLTTSPIYPGGLDISDILIIITQNIEISANITGTAITSLGDIHVYYTDSTPYVGANFTFYRRRPNGNYEGFEDDFEIDTSKWWQARYFYYSYDYPAIGNYNISCYTLADDYGAYYTNLKSE